METQKNSVSLFKRVLFYFNASSQKLLYDIDVKQNLTDADARMGAFIVIYICEFGGIRFINSHVLKLGDSGFEIALVLPIFFHGVINLFFSKELNAIVTNYYSFYNKALLYIFYILLVLGIGYLVLWYF